MDDSYEPLSGLSTFVSSLKRGIANPTNT